MEKNMKMDYMEPVMEVIGFEIRDVVTASNDPYETEDDIF